ncbi:uncharacterized protein C1orf141 homolog isoform X2 [Peromyscus eremicus]|uniref:uncharacterized protein C1orf141 homolog isoform X2 n=1 Tax=Peromyscus eremicus TaxID=42410 RepID=UPI0027DCB0BC|nr:uncharacterized protein C1orf141 homolog isoform X2 [Peromyscus eremicus]
MMEKILEKLDALDENARVLAAVRSKKANPQLKQRENPLTTPLLFDLQDLQVEFGGTITPPTSKTVAKKTAKSCDLKTSKVRTSFKYKPKPRSGFEESDLPGLAANTNCEEKPKGGNLKLSPISLRFLKDKNEAEYAKPLNLLQSQPRNRCKRSSESSILYPTGANQSNASEEKVSTPFTGQNEKRAKKFMYSTDHSADSMEKGRKDHPLVTDSVTKENEPTRDNQARTLCPVKQSTLFPLIFEDVLDNPTIKIIDLGPTETVLYSMDSETVLALQDREDTTSIPSSSLDSLAFKAEESHTNPIIFYDAAYIEMLIMIKRFTPYVIIYTRKNIVLEKNCDTAKALFNDEPSTVSEPQRTKPVSQHKDLSFFSTEQVQKSIKERRKRKHDNLASEKRPPNTLYNLSRTFSSLTKRFAGYFDKDATQEKSAKTDGFERIFTKAKPPPKRKFTTLPLRYDSKPLKNILEIRKLNNITPLDNLLTWKVNDLKNQLCSKT